MDSPPKSEDEDREGLSSQIIDYYKKYAQNKQLPKYFRGSSLSYMPQVVVSSGDEVENPRTTGEETNSETLVQRQEDKSQTDVEEGEPHKPISPASSVTSNRKLEWDNGADIGYTNYDNKDKSLFKSLSLPILTTLEDNSIDKPVLKSKVITTISYPSTDDSSEIRKESIPSTSSSSTRNNSKLKAPSSSTTSSSGATQKSLAPPTSSSSSGSLSFFKRKIGSPDAESTPKLGLTETPLIRNPKKLREMRKIVQLCLTKPITVECISDLKTGSNKKVQTCGENSSKSVQTGDSLERGDSIVIIRTREQPKDNQSVVFINCDSNATSSTQTNSDVVDCDSFEYLIGDEVEKSETPESSGAKKSDPVDSSETSNDTPLLGHLIAGNQSKNLATDVDKSIGLLQKLMKSKRYDPATKKRYIKKIVQRIVDSKYEDTRSTDDSSQKNDEIDKLQENVPWYPAGLKSCGKFSIKTFSNEFLPSDQKGDGDHHPKPKPRSIFTLNNPEVAKSAPTSLERHQMSSSTSSYNSWKDDKTLSERLLEGRAGAGDQLVDFAMKERRNQISWINNEINHLSKLKNLLQKNFNNRGIRKTTTVYMVSQKYGSTPRTPSSNDSGSNRGRNFVIETELESSSTSDRLNFNDDKNKNKRITGDIEVVSDDKTTNIKIKARTRSNCPDGAFLTLKQPQLVGRGTYTLPPRSGDDDSDRCWPCGMPKNPKKSVQQFSIDIPLDSAKSTGKSRDGFATTSSQYEANKICSGSTQCKIGCRCKEKSTQSKDYFKSRKDKECFKVPPPGSSKEIQSEEEKVPKFCDCQGIQTDADLRKKKNQLGCCYCEGVQINPVPQQEQNKSKCCYCEGVQTSKNQVERLCHCEGVQTLDQERSDKDRGSQSGNVPKLCFCEGVQTFGQKSDQNRGIQLEDGAMKPRLCFCEGIQTSDGQKLDKNLQSQSGNVTKSKLCFCEGVQTSDGQKLDKNLQSQSGNVTKPKLCFCEGVQTPDGQQSDKNQQSQSGNVLKPKLCFCEGIQTSASQPLDKNQGCQCGNVTKPRLCFCEGVQTSQFAKNRQVQAVAGSKPSYSERVQTKDDLPSSDGKGVQSAGIGSKPRLCHCEGIQTASKEFSLKPSREDKPSKSSLARVCYCEGVQAQDNLPRGIQTRGSALSRSSQSVEIPPKLSKIQSIQSDERKTSSRGNQLNPDTCDNCTNYEGVALQECLCPQKGGVDPCICVDEGTQDDGLKKKCVCSVVQTFKPRLVDDKLQTSRLKTGDEINQTYRTASNKVLQTKSPDIVDEKAQTDRTKISDRKEQTERRENDEKSQTDRVSASNKDVQMERESLKVGVQTDLKSKSDSESRSERSRTSSESSSSWDSSPSSSLRSCSCCKRKNVTGNGLASLRRKLSEQVAPLCKPCYRHYRNLPQNHATNFYNPQHVCQCYTVVQTNTLNEIKKTIDELDELDRRYCTCVDARNRNDSDYCRHCKCKLRKTCKSRSGIAYMLTFENQPIDKSHRDERKTKHLEEIKIKIPVIPKRKKDKVNKKRKERRTESESSSRDSHHQRPQLQTVTLQEHLLNNRPNFVQVAEERRKSVLDSMVLRERDKDKRKLLILQNNVNKEDQEVEKLQRISTENHKRLFSCKEMKDITKKHYRNLPEVQQKLVDNRERQIRLANRFIVDTFSKKLRENALKGKPSLPTDVCVVNL